MDIPIADEIARILNAAGLIATRFKLESPNWGNNILLFVAPDNLPEAVA
jgi:hypothetical protein